MTSILDDLQSPTIQSGLSLLEAAVKAVPELAGILTRGLADEGNVALAELVRARLPEGGESAAQAARLRAERGI